MNARECARERVMADSCLSRTPSVSYREGRRSVRVTLVIQKWCLTSKDREPPMENGKVRERERERKNESERERENESDRERKREREKKTGEEAVRRAFEGRTFRSLSTGEQYQRAQGLDKERRVQGLKHSGIF